MVNTTLLRMVGFVLRQCIEWMVWRRVSSPLLAFRENDAESTEQTIATTDTEALLLRRSAKTKLFSILQLLHRQKVGRSTCDRV